MVKENGKTITATREIIDRTRQYPEVTLITNVKIKGIENKTFYFKDSEELVKILKEEVNTKRKGYLIFIDEIHVVLAELFRKNRPNFLNVLITTKKIEYKYNRNFANV